jgi:hypothetical protein
MLPMVCWKMILSTPYLKPNYYAKVAFAENKERYQTLLKAALFYPGKRRFVQIKDVTFEDKRTAATSLCKTTDIKVRRLAESIGEILCYL